MALPDIETAANNTDLQAAIRTSFERVRQNGNDGVVTLNRLIMFHINKIYDLPRFTADVDTRVKRLKIFARLQQQFADFYPSSTPIDANKYDDLTDAEEGLTPIEAIKEFGNAFGEEVDQTITPNLGALSFFSKNIVWIAAGAGVLYLAAVASPFLAKAAK